MNSSCPVGDLGDNLIDNNIPFPFTDRPLPLFVYLPISPFPSINLLWSLLDLPRVPLPNQCGSRTRATLVEATAATPPAHYMLLFCTISVESSCYSCGQNYLLCMTSSYSSSPFSCSGWLVALLCILVAALRTVGRSHRQINTLVGAVARSPS